MLHFSPNANFIFCNKNLCKHILKCIHIFHINEYKTETDNHNGNSNISSWGIWHRSSTSDNASTQALACNMQLWWPPSLFARNISNEAKPTIRSQPFAGGTTLATHWCERENTPHSAVIWVIFKLPTSGYSVSKRTPKSTLHCQIEPK